MTAFQVPFTIDTLDGNSSPLQDLTNATSDYTMNIGETVFRTIAIAGTTTVPLHIATQTNQVYELIIANTGNRAGGNAGFYLWPNNTNYGNVFIYREIYGYTQAATSAASGQPPYVGINGGSLFFGRGHICTATTGKMWQFSTQESTPSTPYHGLMGNEWTDTTTPWTSLGSFNINYAFTGIVFIKRLF